MRVRLILTYFIVFLLSFSITEATDLQKELPGIEIKEDKDYTGPKVTKEYLENRKWFQEVWKNKIGTQLEDLHKVDLFYLHLVDLFNEAKTLIQTTCPIPARRTGTSLLMANSVCQRSLEMAFPGSSYNLTSGGYIVFANTTAFVSPMLDDGDVQVTKIRSVADFSVEVIPMQFVPGETVFVVTIAVPQGGSAQFTLGQEGIIDIQNISSIYNIEKAFLNYNAKISMKEIVKGILEYYNFVKTRRKISSKDFIVSLITSIPEQDNFVKFYLQKTKEVKNLK